VFIGKNIILGVQKYIFLKRGSGVSFPVANFFKEIFLTEVTLKPS